MGYFRVWLCIGLFLGVTMVYGQEPAPSAWPRQSSGWEEFQSLEGQFRVLSPVPLRERVDSASTPLGTLVYHTFFCKEGADMIYMVSYCDYPENTLHSDSLDLLKEFFTVTMEQSVLSTEGELAYEEDTSVFGFPGKVWRINSPKTKSVFRTRAFVAGSRYYAIQTVMGKGQSLNPSSERFLESFRLL